MKGKSYFYDLHCHTIKSGHASTTLKSIIKKAKERGVDGVAITEHDEIYSGPILVDGISIIPGIEVSTKEGHHLLGFFVKEKIEKDTDFCSAVMEIKRQGGFAFWAHPLRGKENFPENYKDFLELVDGMESGNAMDSAKEREKVSKECMKENLLESSGSDTHASGQVGMGVVEVFEKLNKENFLKSIKEGNIIVREEIKSFREKNDRWRKVIRKAKAENNFLKENFYSKFVLRNYFRVNNFKLRKIHFNHKKRVK